MELSKVIKVLLHRARAVDILSISFLFFLTLLTFLFRMRIPRWEYLIILYSILISILLFLIYGRRGGRIFEAVHDFIFPVAVVFLVFDSLGGLVHYINPVDKDELLIRIDYFLFAVHPTVWLERVITPWLTELLQVIYATYFFLPIVFGILLKIHRKTKEFDLSIFLVILCFYLSFVGYILVPAIGPRFTIDHLHSTPYQSIKGVYLAEFIRNTLDSIEGVKRDAFPSGHTAVALVLLYLSYCFEKGLFRIYLPVITGLIISTVHLRYHYVIDIVAGVILAIVTIYFGERLYRKWEGRKVITANERDT